MWQFGGLPGLRVYLAGAIVASILSGIGTWVISAILLRLYRSRVRRGMKRQQSVSTVAANFQQQLAPVNREVTIGPPVVVEDSVLIETAHRRARRAQVVFGLAGLLYGFTAICVLFPLEDLAWTPGRVAIQTLIYAWPVVPIVLALFPRAQPIRTLAVWAGYIVVLILLLTFGGIPIVLTLVFIGLLLLLPAAFVAATSPRSVRGAAWLVAPALLLLGMAVWQLPLPFVYLRVGQPFDRYAVGFLLGSIASLALLFVYGFGLVAAYRAKLISDQVLLFIQWWFIVAFWFTIDLATEYGWFAAFGMLPLLVMVIFLALVLRIRRGRGERPMRLLLLRTFGSRGRSTRLLRDVTRQWRWIGSVELFSAPDIATEALEPDEFVDFILGRLPRRFINDQAALDRRLHDLDLAPDGDGRYRINEFLCHEDTWQPSVEAVVSEVDAILIDLRGFTATSYGVVHEIGRLVALVDLRGVVALVDESTDIAALQLTLDHAVAAAPESAPIRDGGSDRFQVVTVGSGASPHPQPIFAATSGAARSAELRNSGGSGPRASFGTG
jgi:hypothetical protein